MAEPITLYKKGVKETLTVYDQHVADSLIACGWSTEPPTAATEPARKGKANKDADKPASEPQGATEDATEPEGEADG